MNRKTDKKGNAVSVLFTMLLFLVFVLCALFTVLIGSRVYENINVRSDANYTGSTALSYIARSPWRTLLAMSVSYTHLTLPTILLV